jgi:molybdenum cofactor cytidylyltransferase
MGVPKLLLELAPGNRLGTIALRELLANPRIHSVSAVVRSSDIAQWNSLAEPGHLPSSKLRYVPCEDAAHGMSYSLRSGLADAMALSPDAILVALADQPFITSELIDDLIEAYRAKPKLDFVACDGGTHAMPPALIAPSLFEQFDKLEGDVGARKLFASPEYSGALIPVSGNHVFTDIDTPFELKEARSFWKSFRTISRHSVSSSSN